MPPRTKRVSSSKGQKKVKPSETSVAVSRLGLEDSIASEARLQRTMRSSAPQGQDRHPLFTDPRKVEQWVANSMSGSSATPLNTNLVSSGSEYHHNTISHCMPGQNHPESMLYMSHSESKPMKSTGMARLQSTKVTLGSVPISNGEIYLSTGAMVGYPGTASFLGDSYIPGNEYGCENWLSGSQQPEVHLMNSFSAGPHQLMPGTLHPAFPGTWDEMHSSDYAIAGHGQVAMDPEFTWPSPSVDTLDPSVSSSYSPGHVFPQHYGSPIAYSAHDSCASDDFDLSPLNVGPAQVPYGTHQYSVPDNSSTLRPSHGFSRPGLNVSEMWLQNDHAAHGPMGRDAHPHRREGEAISARSDGLYQCGPGEDGLYHCPFEQTENCTHRAEKLKCNYDKHLDSHLKPYRCKVSACLEVPFSSTACLLRHEREAHGMHGHGDKPYNCTYEDCDRSILGNGFPRHWNLKDHMKRMHDHALSSASSESNSPKENGIRSQDQSKGAAPSRRRRASKELAGSKNPKPTATITKAGTKPARRLSMPQQWTEPHAALSLDMEGMDLVDLHAQQGPATDFGMLYSSGRNPKLMARGRHA